MNPHELLKHRPASAGTEIAKALTKIFMNTSFLDHYRCPEGFAPFGVAEELGRTPGYFRFGKKITCFGRAAAPVSPAPHGHLTDVLSLLQPCGNQVLLPFDPDEIVENLLEEKYVVSEGAPSVLQQCIKEAYYFARPFLSVGIRKHFQRFHLRERKSIEFPAWPLDQTVDHLRAELMSLAVRANEDRPIPFIWFWPDEYQGCVLMTHDVEHEPGRAFCGELMDLDGRYGIRSAFEVVPEERYALSEAFLESIPARGFELNVHDLNHDGHLFENRRVFLERIEKINAFGKKWRAEGFRSGAMYRNAAWKDAFQFSYDMSFASAAHLEPQKGGCCTAMPYFLGELVELPLTTTQDYTLFHILGQYSIDLWKEELSTIAASNGLATFIVHPDYVIDPRARVVYESLLESISGYCRREHLWQPLPRDAAHWWRQRSQMHIAPSGGSWAVTGPGSERARVAFAQVEDGRLIYQVQTSVCGETAR